MINYKRKNSIRKEQCNTNDTSNKTTTIVGAMRKNANAANDTKMRIMILSGQLSIIQKDNDNDIGNETDHDDTNNHDDGTDIDNEYHNANDTEPET